MKGFDKKNWKKITFGEVCKNLNVSVRNPLAEGLERYIGLEHIESENLHIKTWGNIAEGTTFTKKFSKGQVLFGKRRAYLKKAAIAEFDGICSGDILVFEANEKVIDLNLFPFLVSSESFFNYAVQTSAGSLSPRTKFQDLVKYEFLLPPKDAQAKLAELLWAGDEVVEKHENSKNSLEKLQSVYYESEFSKSKDIKLLSELGNFFKGKGIAKSDVESKGISCVRYGELYTKHQNIVRKYNSFISREVSKNSFRLQKNDVIFAGSGETIEEIGKSASIIDDSEVYAGSDTIVFRPFDMNGIFLGYYLNSKFSRSQLNRMGKGATIAHIYINDLKTLKVKWFELPIQNKIANRTEEIYKNIENSEKQIWETKQLQKQLINQIFG